MIKPEKKTKKHPLLIDRVAVEDPEYISEVPERMRNIDFPGFPSCSVFLGKPGSGKTNTFIYMLKSPLMWNKFFDKVYLLGPTVTSDKLYKQIQGVPEDNIVDDQENFIPKLEEWLSEQKQEVDRDPAAAPKCLFVFEDVTSFYDQLQRQPAFARCYTQVRHLKGSSVAMVHKYKAFNRTARMSTQHILAWQCNKTEIKQLYEDFGPSNLSLKEWFALVRYCHEPTEDDPKPFLYINTLVPEKVRYRKGFYEILVLDSAAKEGAQLMAMDKQQTKPEFVNRKRANSTISEDFKLKKPKITNIDSVQHF